MDWYKGIIAGLIPGLHINQLLGQETLLDVAIIVGTSLGFEIITVFTQTTDSEIGIARRNKNSVIWGYIAAAMLIPIIGLLPKIELSETQVLLITAIAAVALIMEGDWAFNLFVFMSAGILGMLGADTTLTFAAMFAVPTLIRGKIKIDNSNVGKVSAKPIILATIVSPILIYTPGMTSIHALVFILPLLERWEIPIALGFLRVSSEMLSFVAAEKVNNPRSLAALIVRNELTQYSTLFTLVIIQLTILVSIAVVILFKSKILKAIEKAWPIIRWVVLAYILVQIRSIESGLMFLTAVMIGLVAEKSKPNTLGFLILPTIMRGVI